jgi:branched-chain amino acid aminotransferase
MDFILTQNGALPVSDSKILQINPEHSVYEVIRLIDGKALFLEDHFERLRSSVNIRRFRFEMEFSEFKQKMAEIASLNQKQNGNVKFILSEFEKKNKWSFSFIPHSYPTPNDYAEGVKTGLLFAERENPNAKVVQNLVREKANQMISSQDLYEVLLVDRNGQITEGSRSNAFFVKGNWFYTAPASVVLVGITRQKVLECLNKLAFPVIEEAVLASEINDFDAVFLTGTSPKVLPVKCIDNIRFQAKNVFVEQLKEKYNSMIERYLYEQKSE